MNINLRAMLTLHEGRRDYAYQDSRGFWTIGIGHLIDRRKGGSLPAHIVEALFDHDVETHTAALYKAQPWVVGLDEIRRSVLIDMVFNLGIAGLLKFVHTLEFIKAGDYQQAARGMLNSAWASQVKGRADRLAWMMRTGEWTKITTE